MSLIRNFIVSCRIGQQFRQLSSTVGVSNDKLPSRLPPGYRPINAYALYCQEFLKERKEDSVLLAMSAAAKQWKTMDEKTKAGYEKKSKEIAEERKAALKIFRQRRRRTSSRCS
uniref:HMG box domain-containing protein n=1 Tax=Ditylenchus dipsaci TaxID=166011 RepID=A0A915E139_9BILA